ATDSRWPHPAANAMAVDRTVICGSAFEIVTTWPGPFCPLLFLAGHRWPYRAGHTCHPIDGQCLADVYARWPRTVRPRTTPDTWPPDCHIFRSPRPDAPAARSSPELLWP